MFILYFPDPRLRAHVSAPPMRRLDLGVPVPVRVEEVRSPLFAAPLAGLRDEGRHPDEVAGHSLVPGVLQKVEGLP